jgi:glycosyltransferase involved in cell wall biosynthesis
VETESYCNEIAGFQLKFDTMNKKHLVFSGYNVFPIGFAQTQRLLLFAKGLEEQNCNITVLCRYGTYKKSEHNVDAKGQYEGINYIYCSGLSFRPNVFIIRNIRKIIGIFNEFYILLKYRISGKLDYVFISTNYLSNVLFYSIISKVLFVPAVIDNTEFWSASRNNVASKLYDYLSPLLFQKVICISDYLYNHTVRMKKSANVLKIPAIVDFSKFNISDNNNTVDDKSILFCGSATYYPIIDFIISAFEMADLIKVKLIIVASNGQKTDFERLNERISNSSKSNLIELKSNLAYNDLVKFYINSCALLIPLRPTIQDTARFPHKLGEYTASKGIIITTNNGEIPNYFKDMKNALIADEYDITLYAKKIEYVIKECENLGKLKNASFDTGMEFFDYKKNGKRIFDFLFSKSENI